MGRYFELVERAVVFDCTFENTQWKCPKDTTVQGDMMRHFSIRSSTFFNNTGREGGAVRFSDIADPSITSSTFINNRAAVGGAIYVKSKTKSHKVRMTVLDSSIFINNVGTGLGQSIYNNDDITLQNLHIESKEETNRYHIHSEYGTFEMKNVTLNITRSITSSLDDGATNHGIFAASTQIGVSNGLNYVCPLYMNAGEYLFIFQQSFSSQ